LARGIVFRLVTQGKTDTCPTKCVISQSLAERSQPTRELLQLVGTLLHQYA